LKSINYILINKLKSLPRHGARGEQADPKKRSEIKRDTDEIGATPAWIQMQKDASNELKYFGNELEKARVNAITLNEVYKGMQNSLGGLTSEYSALSMGVGKTMHQVSLFNKNILQTIKNTTYLEEKNKALNKSYGLSSIGANKFSKQLRDVAVLSGVGSDKMFKYAEGIKGLTGGFMTSTKGNLEFNASLLLGQQYLQSNMGLTEEAAVNYERYAASIGKTGIEAAAATNEYAKAIADKTGMDATQVQKDLLEGVANVSSDIVGQYSKMPGNLEIAVMKAKSLGISMDQLHQTGQGLLDIESSVGKELEYQQLTGKKLLVDGNKSLTNEYRMATIRGDGARQAELMAKFIEEEGDNLENNMFARKKAAELFGMQEGDMMRMKQQRDILASMGAEDLLELNEGDVKAVAEDLKERGVGKDEIKKFMDASDTRTTAEISNDYLKSIDEKLIRGKQLDDVGMEKLRKDSKDYAEHQNQMKVNLVSLSKSIGPIAISSEKISTAASSIKEMGEKIPIFGNVLKKTLGKVNDWLVDLKTEGTPEAEDLVSYPGTGARVLTGPFGAFQLNPKDFIMAGDPNNMVAPSGADPTALVAMMVNAINGLTVQATISPDMFMQASELNNSRNLS